MRTLVSVVVTVVICGLLGPAAVASPPAAAGTDGQQASCRRTLPAYPQIKPGTTSGAVRPCSACLGLGLRAEVAVDDDRLPARATSRSPGRVNVQTSFFFSQGGCGG
jgi:hypothetical protein